MSIQNDNEWRGSITNEATYLLTGPTGATGPTGQQGATGATGYGILDSRERISGMTGSGDYLRSTFDPVQIFGLPWSSKVVGANDEESPNVSINSLGQVALAGQYGSNPVTLYNTDGSTGQR